MAKLRKLGELVYPEGPIYCKIQVVLEEWRKFYEALNDPKNKSLIIFLEHFGELKKSLPKGEHSPEKISDSSPEKFIDKSKKVTTM